MLLLKQQSMDNRVRREQFKATKDAQAIGMASSDKHMFVDQRLADYKKVELIRRSVRDVQIRAQELDSKRRMQGSAYTGVKSKIARNIKVVDRVNRNHGFISPHKRPHTAAKLARVSSRKTFVTDRNEDKSWERNCTNHSHTDVRTPAVKHYLSVDKASTNDR